MITFGKSLVATIATLAVMFFGMAYLPTTAAVDARACPERAAPNSCVKQPATKGKPAAPPNKGKGKRPNKGRGKSNGASKGNRAPQSIKTVYIQSPPKVIVRTKKVHIVRYVRPLTPAIRPVRVVVVTPEPDKVSKATPLERPGELIPGIRISDGKVTPQEVVAGTLTITLLALLGILGMFAGYSLGYKDRQRDEQDFIQAVLEAAVLKRR